MMTRPHLLDLAFHHLGVAVDTAAPATALLGAMGYVIGPTIRDPLQKVDLALCHHATMPTVEIIARSGESGPLDQMLARHRGGLTYHQCFVSADLERTLDVLETDLGLRVLCLSEPKPAVLFGGRHVSFYQIDGFGMIEILA